MTTTATTYELRVAGHLDDHWSAILGGLFLVRHDDGTTTLTGPLVDQAQLHGVLAAVRDLGAPLLSLRAVDPADSAAVATATDAHDHPPPRGVRPEATGSLGVEREFAPKSADAAIADVGGQRRVKDLSGLEAEGLNSVEDALARTEQDGRDVEGELVDHAGVQRLSHG